jgi:hypothetical protein
MRESPNVQLEKVVASPEWSGFRMITSAGLSVTAASGGFKALRAQQFYLTSSMEKFRAHLSRAFGDIRADQNAAAQIFL